MPSFKTAYLIHGDDHGRVAERRASLRRLAEAQGDGGVQLFEDDQSTPDKVAQALCAMTFGLGRRFLIVDGVERWKDDDVQGSLVRALAAPDPDTTVAFFAREDGRFKAPAALIKAVQDAGGDIAQERSRSTKELPDWVIGQGRRLGVTLDREAAATLVAAVGARQQRLVRELEKLAIEYGTGVTLDTTLIEDSVADAAAKEVWGLGDAVVAADGERAVRQWLVLREWGEPPFRLLAMLTRRLRDVYAIAARLQQGESPAQIKATIKGNPWALDRRIGEARRADVDKLAHAIERLAALERDTRGGSHLSDDTLALRALLAIGSEQ